MAVDPVSRFRLDGRVAVVTGASSGLGARFARVLDAAGARVVLVARREDRLREVAAELTGPCVVVADLAAPDTAAQVAAVARDTYGRIDVLVNNAGIVAPGPALDAEMTTFQRVVDVNVVGTFALTRAVANVMVEGGGGSVVNVASVWGLVGIGQIPDAAYAASKSALVGMTRELGAQWARRGVRVNALAPGWFHTEMTDDMFADPSAQQWMRSRTPMGRTGEEHELDGALLFLASDASSYVTGVTLPVDGGWTAI